MNARNTRKTNRMGTAAGTARATRRVRLLAVLVAVLTGLAALPAAAQTSVGISAGTPVTEGTAAEFTVAVTAGTAPSADLTLNLTVFDAPNSDFVAAADEGSKTVTLAASETTVTFSVPTQADTVDEPDSTVTVLLEGGDDYTPTGERHVRVTVNDDDGASTPTRPAGCGAVGPNQSEMIRSLTSTGNSIDMTFGTGTFRHVGQANLIICEPDQMDVYSTRTALAWASAEVPLPGETASITGLDPETDYWVRYFVYTSRGPWYYIRTAAASSSDPTVTIAAGTSPVTEGTAATFTVTASSAPSANLTVNLTVADASGSDFVASGDEGSKTVTIAASATTATHSVPTTADSTDEPNGNVTVTVNSGTGYTVGSTSSASVTVNDDDATALTAPCAATSGQPGFFGSDFLTLTATDSTIQLSYTNKSGTAHKFQLCKSGSSTIDRETANGNLTAHTFSSLDADTDYWVRVVEASADPSNWHHIRTAADSTPPTFSSATVNGATLKVVFDENLDTGSVPAPGDFDVQVAGSSRNVGSGGVAIADDTVTLTLSSAASAGEIVTVAYAKPSANPLQDAAGNDVADFAAQAVTNNTPATTPAGALVSNTGQTDFEFTFANDFAQAFTTGSNSAGYTLTRVDVFMKAGTANPTYTAVGIHADASGVPGDSEGALTTPGNPPAAKGAVQLAASGAGIALDANTTYWLVMDLNTGSNAKLFTTASDDQDPGAAAGWSIANDLRNRALTLTTWVGAGTQSQSVKLAVHATAKTATTTPPDAPAAPTVAGVFSSGMEVSWAAPASLGTGTAVTDYDLRYFAGTADPANEADWVEEGETNGPPNPGTSTSAIITGLTADQAYRVQVRAAAGHGESPWSASVAGTPANQAPRVLVEKNGVCRVATETDLTSVLDSNRIANALVHLEVSGREENEWTEFPADCSPLDDRDGDALTYAIDTSLVPDNVRFPGQVPLVNNGRLLVVAFIARQLELDFDLGVTATDPDGLSSAKGLFGFRAGGFSGSATPSFSDTVAAQTWTRNAEITELTLPAAGGGDLETEFSDSTMTWPYLYEVSGLPAGLSFDADSREITGTPTATGSFTVTYTAQDADDDTGATDTASLTFAVTVNAPSATTPTPGALVSNHGQADDGTAGFANDLAQPFTTGSNTAGYKLTSVEVVGKNTGTTAAMYSAAIHEDSSSAPGTKVGDLSAPALAATDAVIKFAASGDGLDLDAATTYWLVIDNSAETTTASIKRTSSTAEDAGAAAGWSIGDSRLFRAFGDTTWSSHTQPLEIGVHGTAKADPPTFVGARVIGDDLLIAFSEDLDTGSVPVPGAFAVTVDGSGRTVASGGVTVTETFVTLTLSSAVTDGQSVTVTYTKPSANPLQDADGDAVVGGVAWPAVNRTLQAAPPGLLVKNTGRQVSNQFPLSAGRREAQGFTTGSNSAGHTGYALTSVGLHVHVANQLKTVEPAYTVSIWSSDSDGHPDTSLGTLTNPGVLGTGINYFQASGAGIDLAAETTYLVVWDVTSTGDIEAELRYTALNEDAGGATGWTVRDRTLLEGSGGWVPSNIDIRTHIAIHGSEKDSAPPTFSSATVNGATLKVVFNEDLDPDSLPAPGDFDVQVASSSRSVESGGVAIADDTVTLTLSSAVTHDEAVTVAYTGPTSNPLQDAAGNAVADFAAQTVTNNTDAPTVVVPTVSVASNGNITAGNRASFTVSASPAPSSNIRIGLTLTQTGGVIAPWSGTIDIQASTTSSTYTSANTVSGTSGSVTLALQTGTGYAVSPTASSATVTVTASDTDPPPDPGPPAIRGASVSGRTVTITLTKKLDPDSVPPPAAFTVTVDGETATVTHVRISSIILTLAEPVQDGQRVTVAYDSALAGTSPLRDLDGNQLDSFDALPVRRDTPGPSGQRDPLPLQLALWTDQSGYRAGETVRLYRTLDPHDDDGRYRTFVYLERAGGGQRRYLAPLSAPGTLHEDAVDQRGRPAGDALPRSLFPADRELIWEGEAPGPGPWQFVMELRPGEPEERFEEPGLPRLIRRAWAKFSVAERSQLLNRRGFDREIREDLTLRSDTLYYLGHQLFVHAGATLTIEPGTTLRAFGRNTAIIVEPGGRIVAEGTRETPVVLGCSSPAGLRRPGCWAGLRILGRAPVTRLEGVAPGVLPAERPVYGGTEAQDSSGVLRYVRVEFAGAAGDEAEAAGPAIGLYGAGSGTLLDHVQAHASLGDGFAFSGGTAVCNHCVASSSGNAGLSWERGWRGGASHLYVQQGGGGLDGLTGGNDGEGHDLEPRSLPTLSNVTLVHAAPYGRRERRAVALRLSTGSGVLVSDLLTVYFQARAIDARGRSALLFSEGESAVRGALLYRSGTRPLQGTGQDAVEFTDKDPELRDVRDFANPDPRPKVNSPALPDGREGYIGAFGKDDNWLEEWTVFGPESVYDLRERAEEDD